MKFDPSQKKPVTNWGDGDNRSDKILPKYIGRTISSYFVDSSKTEFTIRFEDGSWLTYEVEGDCCSHSWIEHVEAPNDLVGAIFQGEVFVQDKYGDASFRGDEYATQDNVPYDDYNKEFYGHGMDGGTHECLRFYKVSWLTNKGHIDLEFRNSSNGYYGGNIQLRWYYDVYEPSYQES